MNPGSYVRSTRSGMRNMPNLGGSGACPPENFEKLDPLRLNLRALLRFVTSTTDFKIAYTLQNNNVYLVK